MNRETNDAIAKASEPQHRESTLSPACEWRRNRRDQPTEEAYETPSTPRFGRRPRRYI